ncbi:MAG: hypothetical protein R3208_09305 [Ketobacteraceae bacterium]|nr:hypothetical protein [Ketobacteraceae bacterium]
MKWPVKLVFSLLLIAYPVAVYFGIQAFSVKQVALVLLVLFAVRLFYLKPSTADSAAGWAATTAGIILILAVLLFDNALFLKLYPVFINLVMLLVFSWSLLNPPPVIERLARKIDPQLSELGVRHTRQVTQVWCGFFIVNGAIALYTALFSSMADWALYNGLIAYLLMGLLFAAEFIVRKIRQQRAGER